MDIIKIRKIVTDNFGGFSNATNDQIMTLWRALSEHRKSELKEKNKPVSKTKVKEMNNATINRSEPDVQDNS